MTTLAGLRRRLYSVALLDELGPLYAVYQLWFLDNGISAGQLSSVFVIWAIVVLALEIPSGALADLVDRRRLLAVGVVLRGVAVAVWLIWPSLTGMLIGAVLWAVQMSLASGAWEALVHDQLRARDADDRYATVMARIGQSTNLGIVVAAAVAAVALQLGVGIEALGWITVALHVVSVALVSSLPDVRWVQRLPDGDAEDEEQEVDSDSALAEWWRTLRAGLVEARSSRSIGRLLAFGAVLEGLFVFDEYVPVLARDRGVDDALVPVFVLVVWGGLLVGGEVAARRTELRGRTLGVTMAAGALSIGAALLVREPWALLLVGLGYATLETTWVLSDARLQARISHRRRATVTSVRSFAAGIVEAIVFATIGFLAVGDDPTRGMLPMAVVLLLAGLVGARWIPDAGSTGGSSATVRGS
ncbi:MAG: MFS transporter [Actinomycetota bacterium]